MNAKCILFVQIATLLFASVALASPANQFTPAMKDLEFQAEKVDAETQALKSKTHGNSVGCPGQDSSNDESSSRPPSSPSISKLSDQLIIRDVRARNALGNDKPLKQIDDISTKIDNISSRCKGEVANLERVAAIRDAITLLYIERGYITSRAKMPEDWQSTGGTLTFPVIEGQVSSLNIVDYSGQDPERYDRVNRGYNSKYVRDRIQLGLGTPLNIKNLEEQVRLLEIDSLFDEDNFNPKCQKSVVCKKIDAILRPAASMKDGESDLIVRIPPTRFFRANFNFDNSSPPSIGAERLKTDFSFANLAGLGDNLVASFQIDPFHSSKERFFRFAGLSYQLPLNSMNGTIQLRAESRREKIIQEPFDQFNLRAKAELYEIIYRQPLVHSYTNEFALSLGLTVQNGQTFVFNDTPFPFGIGPDKNGVSRTSVIKFGQDYIHRGVTGTWLLKSQFSLGTGLFGATNNLGSIPDGKFISWLGQVQRLQQLGDNHLLIMQADLQLSPNPLLPSQQFVIGGSQSLRGYRQNVRFGDNGFHFSLEDRITLSRDKNRKPIFQLAPFVDVGTVWNQANNPNQLPSQNLLAGTGIALLWQPLPKLNLRLDYALPLIDLRDRGETLQDNGVYFSINYQL
jgi:hemolysin activation/secretion protein